MRKINYKSDFDAVLRLRDCRDPENFVPWPDCDFEVVFWTSGKARCHTASRNGGTYTNCFATGDGGIHFVFDNHRMGIGTLKWEPHFALPNGIYPDGIQDVYRKADLGITLVDGEGDCPTTADVEVLVPYIKFKYGDLTDAEKAELGKPATDAAASVAELERSVETAEAGRVEGEKSRVEGEKSRVAAETVRQTDEATRQSQEAQREEAENEREENEDRRVSAESKRAEEFAAWESEIDSKADRSELSNIIAEEPLMPDNFPDINTYTREELKMDLFVDMWNDAWGKYGGYDPVNAPDAQHPFMGNEIWLTYKEALNVLSYHTNIAFNNLLYAYQHSTLRTFIPPVCASIELNMQMFCANSSLLEKVVFDVQVAANNLISAFHNCPKLRVIEGNIICPFADVNSAFKLCTSLEEVRIIRLSKSISFSDSPKLSRVSIICIVTNASNTSPITITVHPDVYAKLTDESNAEWHQVLLDAAEKDITFATT